MAKTKKTAVQRAVEAEAKQRLEADKLTKATRPQSTPAARKKAIATMRRRGTGIFKKRQGDNDQKKSIGIRLIEAGLRMLGEH